GAKPKPTIRFKRLHAPPIECIPDDQPIEGTSPAAHPYASHQDIHSPTQAPQPVAIVPAGGTTDASDGCKGLRRWSSDVGDAGIHQATAEAYTPPVAEWTSDRQGVGPACLGECTVLMAERQGDGVTNPLWLNAKALQRRGLMDDGRVAHTLDECAADAGVEWRDQTQPQAREPRCQDRDRNHQTAQAALAGKP